MANEQLALVIVASIWAAFNTLVAAYRVVNEKRDVLVTGRQHGDELSVEHRRLMFQNDWIPLKFGVALASLMFSVVLVSIPRLAQTTDVWVTRVSTLAALAPLFSFLGFGILGFRDYQFIRMTLKSAA
jgi:hypothetical protein